MRSSFLLTGSNLGDRSKNLKNCLELIEKETRIIEFSGIFESEAWGIKEQPNFLNQVLKITTFLEPKDLLEFILGIEQELGRERKEKWGSRLIDIDILFYEKRIINEPELRIPHPEIQNRMFTLMPLADIAPQFVHPETGLNVTEMMEKCEDPLKVWPYDHSAEATSASR